MKFEQYQSVKLNSSKYTDIGLKNGAIGTVLEVYGDGYYEVDFSDNFGTTIVYRAFPETELTPL